MIQNVPGRETRSLNGKWQTIVDPYETGYYMFGSPSPQGFFRNHKPRSPSDRVEYDFDRSDRLDVPGDWNSQRERLFFYEGTVWYKRDFQLDRAPDERLFVHFGAVNYEAKVWLNGEAVGEHVGGFTPFAFEITDLARAGENFLVLKVDNRRLREGVPTLDTDWWNYGGITRDVDLIEVPKTFLREYALGLDGGWVQLDGPQLEQTVRLRVGDVEVDVATDSSGRGRFELGFDPRRWSPDDPFRYDVELRAGDDRVRDQVGFRSVETRGHDILVNGEPIFLRGISIHEEAPVREGRAWSEADARTLLGWARELGCNFVRLAHYPHNEAMVRVADEMGLLAWCEIPVYWSIDWENPDTLANARGQLRDMITRDRNRACVILWSVGNETPAIPERHAFMGDLASTARDLDPTRLVTAALLTLPNAERHLRLDDPLGEHLDVLASNEYLGWYYAKPDEIDSWSWSSAYEKPLILSELGGGALAGHRGARDERWTEDYQAHLYEKQIEMFERIPFLRGITPWILNDFRSPKRVLPGIQDYYNRKGLVSDRGARKLAFSVLQAYYRRRTLT